MLAEAAKIVTLAAAGVLAAAVLMTATWAAAYYVAPLTRQLVALYRKMRGQVSDRS